MAFKAVPYVAAEATVAVRRQLKQGFYDIPRTKLMPLNFTRVSLMLDGNYVDPGVEIGAGSLMQQRQLKDTVMPMLDLTANLRAGGIWQLFAMTGWKPVVSGVPATATPVSTTLTTALKRGHSWLDIDPTDVAVGDYLMIGTASVTPASTDNAEVYRVAALASTAASEVYTVIIVGNPTGGSYKLKVNGFTTAAIAYDANAAAVQAALVAVTGASTWTVTGSGTVLDPFIITASGSLANIAITNRMTAVSDDLTGGTGWGSDAGLGSDAHVNVTFTTEGHVATAVRLDAYTLLDHAAAEAVVKVDAPTLNPFTTTFFHVRPSDVVDTDWLTTVVDINNGVEKFRLYYFDGKVETFSCNFAKGSVPSVTIKIKFCDVLVADTTTDTYTTVADPASFLMTTTRGTFDFLDSRVVSPNSVALNIEATIPDDYTLFHLKPQSLVHTMLKMDMTADIKFVRSIANKVNFNDTGITVSDVVPEYPLTFTFQALQKIGASTQPYQVKIVGLDVQFGGFNPELQQGDFIRGSLGMIRFVPSATQVERQYIQLKSAVYSANFAAVY